VAKPSRFQQPLSFSTASEVRRSRRWPDRRPAPADLTQFSDKEGACSSAGSFKALHKACVAVKQRSGRSLAGSLPPSIVEVEPLEARPVAQWRAFPRGR